nr:DUF4115 domain-containing protein [bacterium]
YAESVGMNLDRVLESFEDLEYIPPLQTETEPVLESEANSLQETQPAEHRIPSLLEALPLLRWLLIVAVATVTLLLLGGLYLLIESPLEEPVEQPVRQQSENITPPPAPQPTDSSLFVVEKVNLAFLFTDSCYLKVSRDDSLFTELIYLPGDSVAFTSAGNLNVTVGNPQAAVIYFNGRNAGNVGQTNRPAHLLVDPGGIQHSSLRNQP